MKRPLTIAATIVMTILILYACSSTIRTAKNSFVTITIGNTPNIALLKAEAATPWMRFRNYLAEVKWMPEVYAYIPSVVQVIVVTVTAPDIGTPIVGVDNINATDTVATIRIEVPNGSGRQFLVEGYRGLPGGTTQLFYSGTVGPVELSGTEITLPVSMALVGPGIWVSPTGNDTSGTGTQVNPYLTISKALSTSTGTDAILVTEGTYTLTVGAGPSTLLLKPGNALICTGPSLSTVIDASLLAGVTAIRGNNNASIDNCLIRVSSQGTGVIDVPDPQNPTVTAAIRINGSVFEIPSGATSPTIGVTLANDKSMVIDSKVTGIGATASAIGVQIQGGKPTVVSTTISGLATGVTFTSGAGDALVSGNTIIGNTTGISISAVSKPTVENNIITGNQNGIVISLGTPLIRTNAIQSNFTGISINDGYPEITNNSIDHNNAYGVNISGSSTVNAKINNNNIFCNSAYDVYIPSAMTTIDLQDNAWDHDSGTNPPGPLVSNSGGGLSSYDIVYSQSTPTPLYDRIRPAVPGGCVLIPQQ